MRAGFHSAQAGALVDNPDQRIAVDVRAFTDTALTFSVVMLNALIDLVSFSGALPGHRSRAGWSQVRLAARRPGAVASRAAAPLCSVQ